MSLLKQARPLAVIAALVALTAACSASKSGGGGDTPTGPSVSLTAKIRTTDVLSGNAVSGATVSGSGLSTGTTDGAGSLTLTTSTSSTYGIDVANASFITRNTLIKVPGGDAPISLIRSDFNLTAFDQMYRSDVLRRWMSAPALRVVNRVLDFVETGQTYAATDELLTQAEIDTVVANMNYGLPLLTGGVMPAFAGVSTLSVAPGEAVPMLVEGRITFARCRGLNAIGLSGRALIQYFDTTNVITGALLCVDRNSEVGGSSQTLGVRLHELAHTLGATHVSALSNVLMTATISVNDITAWDRDAAKIAYQRPAGSRTPDRDPSSFSTNSLRLRTMVIDGCRVLR